MKDELKTEIARDMQNTFQELQKTLLEHFKCMIKEKDATPKEGKRSSINNVTELGVKGG